MFLYLDFTQVIMTLFYMYFLCIINTDTPHPPPSKKIKIKTNNNFSVLNGITLAFKILCSPDAHLHVVIKRPTWPHIILE